MLLLLMINYIYKGKYKTFLLVFIDSTSLAGERTIKQHCVGRRSEHTSGAGKIYAPQF